MARLRMVSGHGVDPGERHRGTRGGRRRARGKAMGHAFFTRSVWPDDEQEERQLRELGRDLVREAVAGTDWPNLAA